MQRIFQITQIQLRRRTNIIGIQNFTRSIMSVEYGNDNPKIPMQEEVRLDLSERPSEKKSRTNNPKSNAVKRKRPSHRKPPRTNFDSTSPLGVMTEFEIPNMLKKHHKKVCKLLDVDPDTIEPLTIKDVMNPVRDIINDAGVLDAFNWRELRNVEVLSMSAKGDGLAIIRAPTMETVLKYQEIAHQREKKEIEEYKKEMEEKEKLEENSEEAEAVGETGEGDKQDGNTHDKFDGQQMNRKRQRQIQSDEPYRRTVLAENLPKVQIATVPFAFPGDFVNIKVYHTNSHYVDSEIMEFTRLSPLRSEKIDAEESDPNEEFKVVKPKESACAYFGICSGCQYQSLSYENQLLIKKEVVENAYKHFCKDEVEWEGKVLDTVASPLKFGYRTKLTPHYDVPRGGTVGLDVPRLGFGWRGKGSWLKIDRNKEVTSDSAKFDNSKLLLQHPEEEKAGMRERSIRPYFGDVLDIEDCIIGTDIVRLGLVNEREKLKKEWDGNIRSKKGVTVLLRENSVNKNDEDYEERIFGSRKVLPDTEAEGPITRLEVEVDGVEGVVTKTCVTDNQKIVSDLVDTGLGRVLRFDFIANEFFQNNNSILPKVIKYVKDNLGNGEEMEYLVDAYCGSGLFSVAIASDEKSSVKKVLGVEISERAVEFAKRNAALNNISSEHCDFIQGKAEKLFEHIDFPKDKTGVILDPPRKGCDDVFLKQLSEFEPNRIVYVSCNVHSQARDVKYFLNETANGSKYKIDSIRGFDFFPQTHHVESVAVLVRK